MPDNTAARHEGASSPSNPRPEPSKREGAPSEKASRPGGGGLSSSELRAVFDGTLDAILIADNGGWYVDANPSAAHLLGLTREEIIGRHISDFCPPGYDFPAAWAAFLGSGQSRGEFSLHRPDGQVREVEFVATAGFAPGRHLSILRDVSERKKIEAENRKREQELSDFIENAPTGLHWVGPDGMILWANQAELEMLGYEREEYVGHHIAEFHVDADVIEDILSRLTGGETLRQYEARLRCKDGSIKQVQINSNVKWEDGRFIHTRCFTRDVTERRKSQEAILEAQRQLQLALNAARMGTWSWNIQTSVLDWSENLEEIHGLAPGTFRGTYEAFLECVHPEDREMVYAGVQRAVEERSSYDVVFRVPFSDGSIHWVAGHGQVFVDAEGSPTRMIGIGRDVTEQRAAEVELERAYQETQEALKLRDNFLSVAGHEFRTPLGALSLMLHNLSRKAEQESDHKTADAVRNLHRQVDRLVRLTEDLLEVGRIKAGKVTLEPEPTELGSLVREVTERLEETAQRAGSRFDVIAPKPVVGLWDRSRLDQVLTNLLANAVKFGGGRPVEILLGRSDHTAQLTVRDQGIGISPDDQERIFERFERAVSDKHYRGIGLGLWIAREIVVAHGGHIGVRSEPGKGAAFRVDLPGALPEVK